MYYRHKLLLLNHPEIVEKREQSGENCRIRASKIVSNRYQEEKGSLKYKISWKEVEKISREGSLSLAYLRRTCYSS